MTATRITIEPPQGQKPFFIGLDVGGTNIKMGLVDEMGRTIAFQSIPTEQQRGAEDACGRIASVVEEWFATKGISRGDVVRAGIATPGPIDLPSGMILRPGNIPGWWDFPIRDRIAHHLGIPTTFANDANAAAYGEYWMGAGKGYGSLVLLTLGTGIGGGITIGDTLVEGAHSCGGECGHILVNPAPDAPLDSLGNRGSLESYANASAVVNRARAAIERGDATALAKRQAAGEAITPRVIAEEAERGDKVCRDTIFEAAHWLAIGIVTFIHTIDPDAVVLGGAMTFGGNDTEIGREFLQRIRSETRPRLLEPLRDTVRIELASLGGDAGYLGAAGLARLAWRQAQCK